MAKQETMEAIEDALDRIDDTLVTLERIPKANLNGTTKNEQIVILTTVAAVSGVASVAAYIFIKRQVNKIIVKREIKKNSVSV